MYIVPAGLDVPAVNVSSYVLGLQYTDSDSKADKLTLTIDNDDLSNFDDPIWRDGNGIRVSWGYAEELTVERLVTIKRVIGFRELRVEAVGGELALDRIKRVRTFENRSYSDIATEIAISWGFGEQSDFNKTGYLPSQARHIEETPTRYPVITQPGITDADMLRRLAAKTGFRWFLNHDGFHFHSINFLQPTAKRLRYYGNQNVAEILDVHIEMDVTRIAGDAEVASFNVREGPGIKKVARNATNPQRAGLAKRVEAAGLQDVMGIPGYNMPADAPIPAFGLLPVPQAPSLGPRVHYEMKRTNETAIEAIIRAAEIARERMMRGVVKMKVSIVGDPSITAGTVVEIDGIGKRLNQRYYVSQVEHRIGSNGYQVDLECVVDGTAGHSTKSKFLPEAVSIQMMPKALSIRTPTLPGPGIKLRDREPRNDRPSPPDVTPSPFPAAPLEQDQLEMGNIDLRHRPYHKNENGTYSTISSMSVTFDSDVDGKSVPLTYLLPTIADDGTKMTGDEAVQYFKDHGKHLGIFRTVAAAEAESERLHLDQEQHPPYNTLGPIPADVTLPPGVSNPPEPEPAPPPVGPVSSL